MIKRIVSGIICCFFTITAGICLGQTDREKIYDPLEYLYARHEDDRLVKVQLHGACVSCTVNQMTLKSGVEMTIKKHAPQIEEVISIEP